MKRIGLVIGLGIDIASAALFVLGRMVIVCNASSRLPMVPVVVAARDLPQGVLIDRTAVYVAMWPGGTQPARAYTTVDAVVGRMSGRDIQPGDALVPDRLAREQPTDRPDVKTTRATADGVW
jgi:Flp pilus assembly protein CpaB